jgi:hypothetical protein
MLDKIIFYNHYHRGDIFTHRGFIQHLKKELPSINYEYLHFNHPKLTRDLEIPLVGDPNRFSKKNRFHKEGKTFFVNTWVGAYGKLFKKHRGLNMDLLYEQWAEIFRNINEEFGSNIVLKSKEEYLPTVDFSFYDLKNIDEFFEKYKSKKTVLLCNGSPKSNQSFLYNMESFINNAAEKFPEVIFICTEKFKNTKDNIFYTDDIIRCEDIESKRAPWEDMAKNICDLPEISYVSEKVDLIVGKNSGPFCFCETKNNYLDPNKHFLSFNVSWGFGDLDTESMSYNLKLRCRYKKVQIDNVDPLSDKDILNIETSLENTILELK